MVKIGTLESEVVMDEKPGGRRDAADKPHEVRIEELRAIVRELLREEFERYLRTEVCS